MNIPSYAQTAVKQFFTSGTFEGGTSIPMTPEEASETQENYLAALEDCRVLDESVADHAIGQPNVLKMRIGDGEAVTAFSLTGNGNGNAQTVEEPGHSFFQKFQVTDDSVVAFRAAREGDHTILVGEIVDRRAMTGQKVVLDNADGYFLSA
jgi:hypothetical protein